MHSVLFIPDEKISRKVGFLTEPVLRADLKGAFEVANWGVDGSLTGGFRVVDKKSDRLLAEELPEHNRKWCLKIHLEQSDESVCKLGESYQPTVQRTWSGAYQWGEAKQPLELHLEGNERYFHCEAFSVIHRDYRNDLEIRTCYGAYEILAGVWFGFWYWPRKQFSDPDSPS